MEPVPQGAGFFYLYQGQALFMMAKLF